MTSLRLRDVPVSHFREAHRHGRYRQEVFGKRVPRYAYSPRTAKKGKVYDWFAEVETKAILESPPGTGERQHHTMRVLTGTSDEFRQAIESGTLSQAIDRVVHGEFWVIEGFWRSKGGS